MGTGQTAVVQCTAEFPLRIFFIYGTDCSNLQYETTTAPMCSPATLSRVVAQGVHFYVWVGLSEFSIWPESDYVLQVCGIEGGPTPAERASWGGIKARYGQ